MRFYCLLKPVLGDRIVKIFSWVAPHNSLSWPLPPLPVPLSFSQGSLLGSLLSRRLFYALGKAKEHVSPFFLAHYVKILLSLLLFTEGFWPFVQTPKVAVLASSPDQRRNSVGEIMVRTAYAPFCIANEASLRLIYLWWYRERSIMQGRTERSSLEHFPQSFALALFGRK